MRRSRKVMLAVLAALTVVLAAGCSSSSEPVVATSLQETEAPVPAAETPAPEAPATETFEPVTPREEPPVDASTTAPTSEEPTEIAEPETESEPVTPEPESGSEPETQESSTAPDPNRPATSLIQDPFCVVGIVAPDTLNVRSGPSTEDPIVAMLDQDECRIYVYGDGADGWIEVFVDRDDGPIGGWVSTTYIALELAPVDPNAPTVVITVEVEYSVERPSSEQPLDAFRLRSDGAVIGFLDINGQITVPADLDISRTLLSAEYADDSLCAWTARLQPDGADGRYTAFLMALCA